MNYQKTEYLYVENLHASNTHTKFQSNIFIFGYNIAKNQVKVMASLLEMQCVAFLAVVGENKYFFES